MKFVELDIKGFGPLAGEKFTFVDGLNVLFGPNESAKTTVHAAIFAGLCGVRRGQGQPEREDRAFDARHRPWDGGAWEVSTRIELADGRRVKLVQDLAGKVGCKALDERNGNDISSEIQFEGSVDGSVVLGLNRRSFRSTACVRQSEIVTALAHDEDHKRDHSALQQALQRAATSAGQRDETAAAALRSLDEFWRENVGLDDARSGKRPFRRWKREVNDRKNLLEDARSAHEQYLQLLADRDDAFAERDKRQREVKRAEAAIARAKADLLERKAARADELRAKYLVAPGGTSSDQTLADHITQALTLWDTAPPVPNLSGKSSDELSEELARLPERPDGELTPAQEVLDAASDLAAARRILEQHGETEPIAAAGVSPPHPASLDIVGVTAPGWRRARVPMIAAACFLLVGIAATAVGAAATGVALLVAGVAAAGASFWFLRPNVAGEAATIVPSTQAAEVLANWRTRREELKEGVGNGERSLAKALGRHAVELPVGESADAAFERYKTECGAREEQDRQARERDRLKLTLEQRNRAEEQNALREEAIIALRDAGTSAGLSETNPAEIAAKLRAWQDQRQKGLDSQDDAQREWAELKQLMSGRTPAELRDEADKARAVADEASDGFSAAEVESVGAKSAESELPRLRLDHQAAAELAAGRAQLADSQAVMLKSVAEAEAELEEAEEEFARVAELGEILQKTTKYLEEAQRRVYETIAPTLARTLKEWLPRVAVCEDGVTPGPRYNDAHVDPQTLAVRVRLDDGPWRDAAVLSAGTKEQIFLLLRVALTEHLVKDGEVVPLLLDEVTAQCDSTRRKALLELLLELSIERQIILFTHETAVFEWGKANLPAAAVRTLQPIG